jgi:thioredoxin reductase (NADPH)
MGGTPGTTTRPLLLAVDADPARLDRLEGELQRGFGSDFRVRGELDVDDALRSLEGAAERGEPVAVLLVDDGLAEAARERLFSTARIRHPDARRALLVAWGAWADRATATAILHAMAVGHINYYVLQPWTTRDELFRRTVAEFVQEWSRSDAANLREVVVVADARAARGFAVSMLLTRNGIPHAFRDRNSELGRRVLERTGTRGGEVVVWMPAIGGTCLVDPTDTEVVEAWGVPTGLDEGARDFDVLVVGAGPAGLAAAVYASSEGVDTLVVHRQAISGQAATSKLIRNYHDNTLGISAAEQAHPG